MEAILDILKYVYYTLLGVNFVLFLVAFIKGNKDFGIIALYLILGVFTECFSKLVAGDYLLIFGEKTNAPFFLLFSFLQFIILFVFYTRLLTSLFIKKYALLISIGIVFIATLPYIWNPELIMVFSLWLPLVTIPILLFLSTYYFIELLSHKEGYPFINIGFFLFMGSSLIYLASLRFYNDVDLGIMNLKLIINIITLIILHLLFTYQCYLYFKSQIRPLIT